MATDRRRLLQALAAAGALLALPRVAAASAGAPRWLAARRRAGRYEAAVIDARGHALRVIALPDRGHSFAIDDAGRTAVAFGRQPGFFALAFALDGDAAPMPLPLPPDRHFFGHGAFGRDGHTVYATENDYAAGRGVIGVYRRRADGWQRTGEFDSGGIGPHELLLMPDGRTLCVANGGLLTHPDYGKLALNLDSMQPSLAYVDTVDGRLLERVRLDAALHQLSIRHLALDRNGSVWFGCQHSGPIDEQPPLVGRHRRGHAAELFRADEPTQHALRNYVGSVAVDAGGDILATSSPVGNLVVWWDTRDGRCLGSARIDDGCGVAPDTEGGFLLSDGLGGLRHAGPDLEPLDATLIPDCAWDNHLRRV
ncbi:DUF1513 domain-containing protein [Sinimarinibacterium flocculans]|uniref:DUF1513 domain-containing protein n=1 Tax=Sinimarinibacterium flocculans TaxID=985250 RepID=UPI0035188EFE